MVAPALQRGHGKVNDLDFKTFLWLHGAAVTQKDVLE
eukprot:CAMPEP_0172764596 /NCGR_PEP_ID=MMETSP1074-20121228/177538_1 /TAXON_ID=2916 /ORGANISM="Ceratium fusus, Strain PA161109" /LENGTH=36 /DNA_ID= /DNA_START= /DNA_END= /DNA_ORIENTATION=